MFYYHILYLLVSILPVSKSFDINIDGKQVDLNGMIIVIVKCFDYNWTVGSESDWE